MNPALGSRWHLTQGYQHAQGRIAYDCWGDGPPVVLVHGTPFSSFVWRNIVPALSERWTVYAYDLLGYGQSEMRAGQDVSLGVQNGILAELLDYWGLDRPAIVGHDFGGATVLRTHLLNGRLFRCVVLIDAVALSPWGSPFVQHVRRFEEAFQGLPEYIHKAILAAYLQDAADQKLDEDVSKAYMDPWIGPVGQPAFYRQIAQMDQRYTDEVQGRYEELELPVLILWGEQDRWIPKDKGEELHRLMANSTLKLVPQAGHLVQEDRLDLTQTALIEFLSNNYRAE